MKMQSRKAPTLLYWVGLFSLLIPFSLAAEPEPPGDPVKSEDPIQLQAEDLLRFVILGDPALDAVFPELANEVSLSRFGFKEALLAETLVIQDALVGAVAKHCTASLNTMNDLLLSGDRNHIAQGLIMGHELVFQAALQKAGPEAILAYWYDSDYLNKRIAPTYYDLGQSPPSLVDVGGGTNPPCDITPAMLTDISAHFQTAIDATHPALVAWTVTEEGPANLLSLILDYGAALQAGTEITLTRSSNAYLVDQLAMRAGGVIIEYREPPAVLAADALFRFVILGDPALDAVFPELAPWVSLSRFDFDEALLEETLTIQNTLVNTVAAHCPASLQTMNALLLSGDRNQIAQGLVMGHALVFGAAIQTTGPEAIVTYWDDQDYISNQVAPYYLGQGQNPPSLVAPGNWTNPPCDITPAIPTDLAAYFHTAIDATYPASAAGKLTAENPANLLSLILDYEVALKADTEIAVTRAANAMLLDGLAMVSGGVVLEF